jgi:hypothetical protein
VFRCEYSDITLLGKAVTRGPWWRPLGFAIHAANGAVFGLAYDRLRRSSRADPRSLAVPPLLSSPRAFAQATWRHLVFGVLLGRLTR